MNTSYLTQQVTLIIGQLHNLFDEIGVPSHDRDSRESELFASLSETLHNHLRQVTNEKSGLVEEAQRLITTIRQMEASLDETKANVLYAPKDDDLTVTYPLVECLEMLRVKHKAVSKLHQERYEQIRKLLQALESYSSHLEASFVKIKFPPVSSDGNIPPTFDLSSYYINSVDSEFTRVYEEYTRRTVAVQQMSEDIVKLWAELGTPQAQIDEGIIQRWRDAPEQLGLHEDDMNRLRTKREKLLEEKKAREKHLKELRATIEMLWDRLGIDEQDRKSFLAGTRGCGLRTINDLEDELSRLNELKRENLHLFVEDARAKLQKLWDEMYISEEEAVEFTPVFCDVYSDALLSAHEAEITRLETLKEQRAPTLQLIAKHRSLIKDREDLAASSQDASRLMLKPQKGEKRDPTRLLREEKMRKRIAKELPKVEQELRAILEQWEEEYGRPFLVFGERYLDDIAGTALTKPLPPRSKTPNALPLAAVKSSKTFESGSKTIPPREVPTLRSKTPVSTMTRATIMSSQSTNNNRSPSRIPARVPLGTMVQGSNSPERLQAQALQSGKENGIVARKIGVANIAPPPKMRDLRPQVAQLAAAMTPSSTVINDFSRSGSIVRHCPPEDPYGDHDMISEQPPRFDTLTSLQRPHSRLQGYRDMPPPPRPAYDARHTQQHSYTDHGSSTTSSVPSSVASGGSSRQISTTSTTTVQSVALSGSENWESYEDGSVSEVEVDANDAYWKRMQMQQQTKLIREGFGRPLGAATFKGGMTLGPTTAGERQASEVSWTDENGIE